MIEAGDVLLYRPTGLFGRLIAVKTWHPISHVEVSIGHGRTVASRDGLGVGQYPQRDAQLAHVLRPTRPINLAAAMAYFDRVNGQPYGWLDLLAFLGASVDGPGIVCSPFATAFLRAGGLPIFRTEDARKIAPFQFLLSELLMDVSATVGT